jgi:hypothetical protein
MRTLSLALAPGFPGWSATVLGAVEIRMQQMPPAQMISGSANGA